MQYFFRTGAKASGRNESFRPGRLRMAIFIRLSSSDQLHDIDHKDHGHRIRKEHPYQGADHADRHKQDQNHGQGNQPARDPEYSVLPHPSVLRPGRAGRIPALRTATVSCLCAADGHPSEAAEILSSTAAADMFPFSARRRLSRNSALVIGILLRSSLTVSYPSAHLFTRKRFMKN